MAGKSLLARVVPVIDWIGSLFVLPAALVMKAVRRIGLGRMPVCRRLLIAIGVFPIRDHYYEPLFNPAHLRLPFDRDRSLPGIELNDSEQLAWLDRFSYNRELLSLPVEQRGEGGFFYHNGSFESGDAEYLYNIVRYVKPARIIEAGGGFSTLLMQHAAQNNLAEDSAYRCRHTCIEPYPGAWLSRTGVDVISRKVETIDADLFRELDRNDILFIDSSHIIRPQGDVLFLFLEVMPLLKPGVLVHVHDIYTPRDYPEKAVKEEVIFWNEQYLLEAFLSHNGSYRVIGALNYLAREHSEALAAKCPVYAHERSGRQPGSFWLVKAG